MSIVAADIVKRLTGGTNNEDPAASIGGAVSTKAGGVITDGALNNLFDDTNAAESKSGDTEYRCFCIKNTHATLTLVKPVIWVEQDSTSADDTTAIALTSKSKNEAAETTANENTAPSGPSFSAPGNKESGISLPDLSAGDYIAVWVRRTIGAGANAAEPELKVGISGETE